MKISIIIAYAAAITVALAEEEVRFVAYENESFAMRISGGKISQTYYGGNSHNVTRVDSSTHLSMSEKSITLSLSGDEIRLDHATTSKALRGMPFILDEKRDLKGVLYTDIHSEHITLVLTQGNNNSLRNIIRFKEQKDIGGSESTQKQPSKERESK